MILNINLHTAEFVTFCICACVAAIAYIWCSGRGSRNPPLGVELGQVKPKKPYYDAFSPWKCRHVGCNRAPDREEKLAVWQMRQWRKEHEQSMKREHQRCRVEACEHCIELFGQSAAHLNVVDSFSRRSSTASSRKLEELDDDEVSGKKRE